MPANSPDARVIVEDNGRGFGVAIGDSRMSEADWARIIVELSSP